MSSSKPIHSLNLDNNAQKNFIKFYKSLGEKPSTTIRFFDRNEYYSVHGKEDATYVAQLLYGSSAQVKMMAPGEVETIPYVSLSKINFENAVRELLLVKNFRVLVYVNKKGKTSQTDWTLEYKGSPGNLIQFEDILYRSNDAVVGTAMIAIILRPEGKEMVVGLSCINSNDSLMSLIEFIDDDFFAELEAMIVLLGPKECILPAIDGEYERVNTLMTRNRVTVSVRKRKDFSIPKSDIIHDLNNLLRFEKGQQENANTMPEVNNELAMSALGAAIKYMNLTEDSSNFGQYKLQLLNLSRFVHLDSAAVSALNLLPKPGTSIKSNLYRYQSVLGVLDRCRTAQGHRLMAQWIKQPLRNEDVLRDRHNIVQCLLDSPATLSELHDNLLKQVPDILMLNKRLMRKRASLQDLYRIHQVITRSPAIVQTLESLENVSVRSVLSDPFRDLLNDLRMLTEMVEQVIDFDSVQSGEFFVRASFDPELQELKEKLDQKLKRMDRLLQKTKDVLELDSIKLDFVSHLGYHFRITLKDDTVLRKSKKFKVIDVIRGGVRFTNDELGECSQDTSEVRDSYEVQQQSIVSEIVRVAVGYLGPLTTFNFMLAQVDCLVSLAIAAQSAPIPYVRPQILAEGSGTFRLKNVRHPCMELQESMTFIANDLDFQQGETNMYVITGPNMGGKSTFIRSIGAVVLMAQVGSFVPCDEATISMVDAILGRIGATDNYAKGLSTFMVEMTETSTIVRTATSKSLVIIDELGRGTSTFDGCGIAYAIAEHLAQEIRCFTLFATHFHEIAELAKNVATVKAFYMDAIADNDTFTLLYQLKPGVIDRSFGIQVAKLAEFPEHVVKLAEHRYEEFEDHTKNLKTEDEKEIASFIEAAIEKLYNDRHRMSDQEIMQTIEDCRKRVSQSNSEYFRKQFPHLFQ